MTDQATQGRQPALAELEQLRSAMYRIAEKHGGDLLHEAVIESSQRLDDALRMLQGALGPGSPPTASPQLFPTPYAVTAVQAAPAAHSHSVVQSQPSD